MLQEGDVIELSEADLRTIGMVTSNMVGRYVVYMTTLDGGGTGHGRHDVYQNGHHVHCQRLDRPGVKVDFYQSGCFTKMLENIEPVGRAVRRWEEIGPNYSNVQRGGVWRIDNTYRPITPTPFFKEKS